ncbi:phage scaffolding protein [Lactiplantibacillus plantarum]|uniref:phage scaffolding protein n=1 Tax=Lactiplantibacillus plantarum TaxID=1590 RepID=UPI0010760662|nr:phage scaffolding protein [Lactiplantibacillus plantarum]TFZ27290.1 scaffolding protein [Lactiplantibacillus plantarum]
MAVTRDFLKDLGIEGDNLEKIMAEVGKSHTDSSELQKKVDDLSSQNETLAAQVKERDSKIDELGKAEGLSQKYKDQLSDLQSQIKSKDEEFADKLSNVKKSNAIELALRDAGAKDTKILSPLLDHDVIKLDEKGKVTGLKEQLEKIKDSHDYLFKSDDSQGKNTQVKAIVGGNPTSGENSGAAKLDFSKMSYQEILAAKNSNPDAYKQASESLDKGE